MRTEEISFQYRGKAFSGTVAIPESLAEAITALGEKEALEAFNRGYLEIQKRRIRLKRVKRFVKLPLADIPDDLRIALAERGLL